MQKKTLFLIENMNMDTSGGFELTEIPSEIDFTPIERNILDFLSAHFGQIVLRDDIIKECVSNSQKKEGDHIPDFQFLLTTLRSKLKHTGFEIAIVGWNGSLSFVRKETQEFIDPRHQNAITEKLGEESSLLPLFIAKRGEKSKFTFPLTSLETRILLYLIDHFGEAMSKVEIIKACYDDIKIEDGIVSQIYGKTFRQHLYHLRKKFSRFNIDYKISQGVNPQLIELETGADSPFNTLDKLLSGYYYDSLNRRTLLLGPRRRAVLEFLMQTLETKQPLSRQDIYNAVWGENSLVVISIVSMTISTINKALKNHNIPYKIINRGGSRSGYILVPIDE